MEAVEPTFECDPRKAAANLERHGVTFSETVAVFGDPLARIFADENHSAEERREIIVGHSRAKRLLLVCFTEREDARVRIVSARRATRGSSTTMKTTSSLKPNRQGPGELKSEYRFDHANAKPNRFAGRVREGSVAVLLDPDVARAFRNAESVNTVLRALLTTMPARRIRETP